MTEKKKLIWFYISGGIFVLLNMLFISKEIYWFSLFPVLLVLVYLYAYSLDKILMLCVFLTPLAVNIRDFDVGVGLSLPTEPLMFGILLVFLFRILYDNNFDIKISKHPVSILIFIHLVWMFITALTSEQPLISFKYLLSRLWFIVPFYFLATQLFRKKKNIVLFPWLYISALLIVVGYTLINHAMWGFEEQPAHWVMSPFYNDHTAYGAALGFFIPIVTGFLFFPGISKTRRLVVIGVLVVLLVAVILSYTRATWVSIAGALGVYLLIRFRIHVRWVIMLGAIVIGAFFYFQSDIIYKMEKNKQDSSGDFVEHIQSISNISSDASNLERLNRWQAAFRMFEERPIFGWGPGTYQFQYAPFQHSKERTIISTNAGDLGNAHSEYIGPLAESGVLGSLIMLALVFAVIIVAVKLIRKAEDPVIKLMTVLFLLGLVTYYLHGFLNNFLDSDKASVPFWGFTAAIVAMDVYHKNNPKPLETSDSAKD